VNTKQNFNTSEQFYIVKIPDVHHTRHTLNHENSVDASTKI